MGGNVVLTYKRRRVSSRTNEPRANSGSQTKSSGSNTSANLVKCEPTDEYENVPQNIPRESKESRERYDEVELNLLQCENCSTTQNHVEHIGDANKRQKCCPSCTIQQGSTPLDHTGKLSVLEDKRQSNGSGIFNSNDISISGKYASEETDKLLKNQSVTSPTKLDSEQKLSLTLRTFSRRSKEKRNISEPNTAANPDATIMQLMDEVDAYTKEALISEEKSVGDHPCSKAENSQSAAVQLTECSIHETSITQGQESIRDPPEIDCNQPLESDSDVKNLVTSSEAHFSVDPTPKMTETMSSLPNQNAEFCSRAEAISVKSEELADSSPERDYLQLFPESRSNILPLGESGRQKPAAFMEPEEKRNPLQPPSMQPLHPYSSHPHLEQMRNTHPPYPHWNGWHNNLHPQSRETFQNFLQSSTDRTATLARQNLMFNNSLFGAARGNRSNFQNMFELRPNTWLEEELDCLWIGVRRHGKGNWEAMLRDQRLHFLPWKAPLDLAQRWDEEQFRLFHGKPVFQQYAPRPDSSCANFLYPQSFMANFMVDKSRGIQNPGPFSFHSNYGNSNLGFTSQYESGVKGNFPHWMREAAVIPSKPSEAVVRPSLYVPTKTSEHPSFTSNVTHIEMQNGITTPVNPPPVIGHPVTEACEQRIVKEEMDIIPSDASSEETISDDPVVTR